MGPIIVLIIDSGRQLALRLGIVRGGLLGSMITRYAKLVLLLILCLYFYHLISTIVIHSTDLQWDFTIYYYAAKAHTAGLDMYQVPNLKLVSGLDLWLPYVYPPLTIAAFKPFTYLSLQSAGMFWLGLKIVLLLILIFIWWKYFLKEIWSILFLFLLLFAFDSALYWDLKSGNMALLEQGFLWLAFLALMKERPYLFAVLIVAISLFKIATLFFLLLILFVHCRRKWLIFGGSLAVFGLVMGIDYLLQPNLFHSYLARVSGIDERARDYNFGVLALFRDIRDMSAGGPFAVLSAIPPVLPYGLFAAAVSFITCRVIIRRNRSGGNIEIREIISLFCLLSALALPRLKCHSLLLLIVPTYALIRKRLSASALPALILMLVFPVNSSRPQPDVIKKLASYYPLYVVFVIWILYVRSLRRENSDGSSEADRGL